MSNNTATIESVEEIIESITTRFKVMMEEPGLAHLSQNDGVTLVYMEYSDLPQILIKNGYCIQQFLSYLSAHFPEFCGICSYDVDGYGFGVRVMWSYTK